MKPLVFILLLNALQVGAAELPKPPAPKLSVPKPSAPKKVWLSGLQDLGDAMRMLNGLGEHMASRLDANLSPLKAMPPSQQHFELLEAAAGKRHTDD